MGRSRFLEVAYWLVGRASACGTGFGIGVPARSAGAGMSAVGLICCPKAVRVAKRVAGPSTVATVVPSMSLR